MNITRNGFCGFQTGLSWVDSADIEIRKRAKTLSQEYHIPEIEHYMRYQYSEIDRAYNEDIDYPFEDFEKIKNEFVDCAIHYLECEAHYNHLEYDEYLEYDSRYFTRRNNRYRK